MWVCNLVCHIKGRTQTEGAKEDTWGCASGSNRSLVKTV